MKLRCTKESFIEEDGNQRIIHFSVHFGDEIRIQSEVRVWKSNIYDANIKPMHDELLDLRMDCIGAIDGTHFRVKVPKEIVSRYQEGKEYSTQNVLAACTFDLKFTYVIVGWEGSASDSRILNEALTRVDKLVVHRGKSFFCAFANKGSAKISQKQRN